MAADGVAADGAAADRSAGPHRDAPPPGAPSSGRPPTGGPPTDWSSGERVFGPPGGTVDTDWLVPLLLEREPVAPDRAAEALAEAWDALREEAALAGVPAARVDRAQVLRRLGLAGPPGAAPPPERPGDRLRCAAADVVCAAGRLYDAR